MTDDFQQKFFETTKNSALTAPCYEASFAMSNQSALRMYDCVVPKIKELSIRCERCKRKREAAGIHDPPLHDDELDDILGFWQNKRVEADIANLHDKVKAHENEQKCIDWYVENLEQGLSARDLIMNYGTLKQKH